MPRKIKIVQVPVGEQQLADVEQSEPVLALALENEINVIKSDLDSTVVQVSDVEVEQEPTKCLTGKCKLCGKEMLLKNLRYAHPKVCKNRPRPPSPEKVVPPTPTIVIDKLVVNVDGNQSKVFETSPNVESSVSNSNKTNASIRVDLRKQKIKHLLANAF